ncbi:cuticle protein-like [Portunus trituberculatus]|uniref:cuticle protein-like n=1 Tax=Portunus trituberculatus TaxID=210409 RepID=UPI001E1CB187|nr:cuticle protein-like [Portunus trituberculatus]
MLLKVTLLALVGLALSYPHATYPVDYHAKPMPYRFGYGVHDEYSGQHFNRKEHSDGKTVLGTYNVALPDGTKQTVNYRADPYSGFQADVIYSPNPYGH